MLDALFAGEPNDPTDPTGTADILFDCIQHAAVANHWVAKDYDRMYRRLVQLYLTEQELRQ